jgi:hypothetical protein
MHYHGTKCALLTACFFLSPLFRLGYFSPRGVIVASETLHAFQSNKNILKYWGDTPYPLTMQILVRKGGYFQKLSWGSKTSDMYSEGMGQMFGGDFADICNEKISLMRLGAERTV